MNEWMEYLYQPGFGKINKSMYKVCVKRLKTAANQSYQGVTVCFSL